MISATVDLVYINLQPEYELLSYTRFGQFRQFRKIGVGAPSSSATPKKTVFARAGVFVRSYLSVRFDLPSSINCTDISGFPNWGPITLIRGHPRGSSVLPLYSTDMISY